MNGYGKGNITKDNLRKKIEELLLKPWIERFNLKKSNLQIEMKNGIIPPEQYESTLREWNIIFGKDNKNVFEILFPSFPSRRIEEYKEWLKKETERLHKAFSKILSIKGPSIIFDAIVGETIQFYLRHTRSFSYTSDYWRTVKHYIKFKKLRDTLTTTSPIITIQFNRKGNVIEWKLYKTKQSKKAFHTEKHRENFFYVGPEKADEWPGKGLLRCYAESNPNYWFVKNELLVSYEGALNAIKFYAPIPGYYTKTEHYNSICDKWAIHYNWLMENARGVLDAENAKQLIMDVVGFPSMIKERDRLRNRLATPRRIQ